MSSITIKEIKAAVKLLRESHIPPRAIKTKKEADQFNRFDRKIGLKGQWKVGDEYYLCSDLTGDHAIEI